MSPMRKKFDKEFKKRQSNYPMQEGMPVRLHTGEGLISNYFIGGASFQKLPRNKKGLC